MYFIRVSLPIRQQNETRSLSELGQCEENHYIRATELYQKYNIRVRLPIRRLNRARSLTELGTFVKTHYIRVSLPTQQTNGAM